MRLFLDANVLFTAAHNPGGKAALVIGARQARALGARNEPLCVGGSPSQSREEASESLDELDSLLQGIPLVEHHPGLRFPTTLAEKDRPIFQAAVACAATHLLTGDLKDFGPFMNRPGETLDITVQTVSDFLRHTLE